MKRMILPVCLWVLLVSGTSYAAGSTPSPAPQTAATPSTLPSGTVIRVSIDDELDGYRDLAGSAIQFRVLEPVFVDGKMIADTSDGGVGVIQNAGNGLLKISVEKIYTFCGDTIDMRDDTLDVLLELAAPAGDHAFAPGVSSRIHKGTEYKPVTLHLQKVCNAK